LLFIYLFIVVWGILVYIVTYQINSSTIFFFLIRKLNNKQFETAGVILC